MDPRHRKRLHIVQNLYADAFAADKKKFVFPHQEDKAISETILDNAAEIDTCISKHAPKYPLDKIAKIDYSILRLAVFELLIEKQQPTKVIINEAVELAKELGNERSYAFINAVLGSVVKDISSHSTSDANRSESTGTTD